MFRIGIPPSLRIKPTARQATALRMTSYCDPLSPTARFHYGDPVSLQRADELSLLVAQNTRKNQPLSAFQFWQNHNQQFAEQICGDDFTSWRKRPSPHVGDAKIDVIELISSRVFSRGRDSHRVVIDRNHALCSEACRRQRENSRTRPKVEQRSFWFWGAQAGSLRSPE